ncbi:toll/interleukin-1 receptor domain-containing protein [Ruminiclostridium josui]|uniref:toll/interleukin-1 receptor domain-containing protein n=1 Tax=Ruminiclostridium josui TaxID=1499 RepID=UPI0004663F4A|nr:toll/interleukin-1 receptor domain-containing protein [Ruminiclostridium josui]
MVKVFLSCSSHDQTYIRYIINALRTLPEKYKLFYFLPPYKKDIPIDDIIERLYEIDLFILFITNNSLNSQFVQRELRQAIYLNNLKRIKEICPVSLDESINVNQDSRIPEYIRNRIHLSESPSKTVQIVRNFIMNY